MSWTAPTVRTTGDLITASIWNTDLVADLLFLKTCFDSGANLSLPAATTLTLASDACTPTQNMHLIDTEGAAATDILSTLTIAGNIRAGHILLLQAANVAHVVTVKETGNIQVLGGALALDSLKKFLLLILVGTTWYGLPFGGSVFLPSDPILASGMRF